MDEPDDLSPPVPESHATTAAITAVDGNGWRIELVPWTEAGPADALLSAMSNNQGKTGQPGSQQQRDIKPGDEQDRQRQRQQGHADSAEQPGSAADIAKEKQGK